MDWQKNCKQLAAVAGGLRLALGMPARSTQRVDLQLLLRPVVEGRGVLVSQLCLRDGPSLVGGCQNLSVSRPLPPGDPQRDSRGLGAFARAVEEPTRSPVLLTFQGGDFQEASCR